MPPDDLEVIEGETVKKQLKPHELDALVDLWVEETFEPIDAYVDQTKIAVGHALYDHIQLQAKTRYKTGLREHLQEIIEKGDMVIARREGRVIGMVRVMKLDRVGANKFVNGDVYEIGKGLIIPEERGKGVYSKIRQQVVAHLRAKYGDVPILAGTKTEATKKVNRKDRWQEIGFEEYMRIHGAPDDYIESQRDWIKEKGWTAFLYIPNKKET